MNNEELNELKNSIVRLLQQKGFLNDKKFAEFERLDDNHEDIKEIMTNFPPTILSLPAQGLCTVDGWTPFCYLLAFLLITPLMIVLGIGAISVVAILIILSPIIILLAPVAFIILWLFDLFFHFPTTEYC